MPPEQPLPVKCNRIYQIIWANNGDAISRQYAGTAALKVRGKELSILILNSELLEFYLQWRILLCKNSQMFCLFSSRTPVWPFSRRTFCIMLGVKWGRLECLGVLCHRWLQHNVFLVASHSDKKKKSIAELSLFYIKRYLCAYI